MLYYGKEDLIPRESKLGSFRIKINVFKKNISPDINKNFSRSQLKYPCLK